MVVNGTIYSYVNKINNKAYIGKTRQPIQKRKIEHLSCCRRGFNTHFYNALRKYGIDCFDVVILFSGKCTIEDLNKKEELFIKLFETQKKNIGYNITKGGDGNRYISFDYELAKNLYNEHKSVSKVADIMSIKQCNIYSMLVNNNIKVIGKHNGKPVFVYDIINKTYKKYNRHKDFARYLISSGFSNGKLNNVEGDMTKKKDTGKIVYGRFMVFSNIMEVHNVL